MFPNLIQFLIERETKIMKYENLYSILCHFLHYNAVINITILD